MALSKQPSKLWVAGSNPAGRTIKNSYISSALQYTEINNITLDNS